MNARDMVNAFGKKLVGRRVITEKIGFWPGGLVKVTAINPDPNDDNVVMEVKPLAEQTDEEGELFESMGIFWHERIVFEVDVKKGAPKP